jgi:hypothetical protein
LCGALRNGGAAGSGSLRAVESSGAMIRDQRCRLGKIWKRKRNTSVKLNSRQLHLGTHIGTLIGILGTVFDDWRVLMTQHRSRGRMA